ncbi:MAG TPA: penicillin-binding protein activator [Polyangiales bacterium]|nr:penicillin-binding protein activator [Polyangiales bacterium]
MRLPYLTLFLAALLLVGCKQATSGPEIGRLPVLTSDDPQAEAEKHEADELAAHGQKSRAATKYREFLHARPDDALVPLVQLALGRIMLDEKKDGEALALFSSVAQHPQAAVAEQGRFYGAIANQRLGHNTEAIEALSPMVGRTIEPKDTLELLKTLTLAYEAEGKVFEAIATLEQLQADTALPQPERERARKELVELLPKASPADIRRAVDELNPKGYAFKFAIGRAIKDADAARDLERTRQLLGVMQENNLPLDEELSAIQLRAAAPTDANPQAVGALLSLSGRARRVGEQALRGVMLASGLPASGPKAPNAPSVVFRDDGGDPARAVQAVNELVTQHRVIAIIGPLDAQVAKAAGARAQELGVPLLALTPGGSPNTLGNMVFRYFPTAQSEARALAKAAQARGAGTFAVLYPDNTYGKGMLEAFQQEAQALGLRSSLIASYAPGATSFGSEAAALQKESFDALFIPDSSQQLALIAPALAAAGLWSAPRGAATPKDTREGAAGSHAKGKLARNIFVLAPSVGFSTDLPRLAGRYLQGALFSVSFDAQSGEAPVPEFVQHYQEAFGSQPDMFAAFAHDAYRLIRSAVDNGATTRVALAAKLPAARDQGLVTGTQGFTPAREAEGATRVIELQGDAFGEPR